MGKALGFGEMSIEEQLNRFERWQKDLHGRWQTEGSMQKYCEVSLSDQGLRNWNRRTHLKFPYLPWQEQDEQGRTLLQYVIWAKSPYPITWASPSLYRVLGDLHREARPEPRKIDRDHRALSREDPFMPEGDDLVNERSCVELLFGLDKPTRQQFQLLKHLRSSPDCWQGQASRLLRRHTDGGLIPIDVCVTYTGETHDKFFCSAVVTGPVRWPPKPRQRYVCATCHDAGLIRREVPMSDPNFGRALPCPACQPKPDNQALINTTGELVHWAKSFASPFILTDPNARLNLSAYNPTNQLVINNNPAAGPFLLTPMPSITINHDRSRIVLEADTGMYLRRTPPTKD